ncbi:MAG: cytochrome d ubiquinol oxidase subunit II [Flavobacterium sp.]
MGKNITILALIQVILAIISSLLIANMSTLGRIGITLVKREYLIFKTPWKTALAIFAVQMIVILVLTIFKKFASNKTSHIVSFVFLVIGLIGAYYTYIDFTTTSHKHMKFYFHLGFYLFWFNWIFSCIYFFCLKGRKKSTSILSDDINQPMQPNLE